MAEPMGRGRVAAARAGLALAPGPAPRHAIIELTPTGVVASALRIARDHPGEIHLLVTDVVMPQMLGKQVAERMRAIRPGIEVLFMSGYARPVLAAQGRLDPSVALVEKPFSEADLMAMAGKVLNGHFPGFRPERHW